MTEMWSTQTSINQDFLELMKLMDGELVEIKAYVLVVLAIQFVMFFKLWRLESELLYE